MLAISRSKVVFLSNSLGHLITIIVALTAGCNGKCDAALGKHQRILRKFPLYILHRIWLGEEAQ